LNVTASGPLTRDSAAGSFDSSLFSSPLAGAFSSFFSSPPAGAFSSFFVSVFVEGFFFSGAFSPASTFAFIPSTYSFVASADLTDFASLALGASKSLLSAPLAVISCVRS